jgi:hypothetical protein
VFWHLIIIITLVCTLNNAVAENKDEADTTVIMHSPKKATYLALVPGLGQIYNKKYWKLPIVYAGFAATGYYAITNRTQYLKFNEAYICRADGDQNSLITTYDPSTGVFITSVDDLKCSDLSRKYNADQLKSFRDYYRRNMELSYIVMGAWYVLQILDAAVDAHLYYWEVNDDISLRIEPTMLQIPPQSPQVLPVGKISRGGFKITVSF